MIMIKINNDNHLNYDDNSDGNTNKKKNDIHDNGNNNEKRIVTPLTITKNGRQTAFGNQNCSVFTPEIKIVINLYSNLINRNKLAKLNS